MKNSTKTTLTLLSLILLILAWSPWITEDLAISKIKSYPNFQEQHEADILDESLKINVLKTPFCRWATTHEGGWPVCFWQISGYNSSNDIVIINIKNTSNEIINNLSVNTSELRTGKGKNFKEILYPKEEVKLILNFGCEEKEECVRLKSDGSYILRYNEKEELFGYYSNGVPLDKSISIEISSEGVIIDGNNINQKNDTGTSKNIILPKNTITRKECLKLGGEIFNTLGEVTYSGELIAKINDLNCPCACKIDNVLNKIWVEVDPVQCMENAWEIDWLQKNNNTYNNYPRGHLLVIENPEKEIIKKYYEKQEITILNIKSEEYSGDIMVCEACSCSQGYTLYLQIPENDLQKMLEQDSRLGHSYKLAEFPAINCEKYHYSNCPKGCQKQCRSSNCSDGPNPTCTDDCDGPKSCVNFK